MASERRVPSSASTQLPVTGFRSRRGSLASLQSAPVNREALTQVLDEIHTTASRSETLTSFRDFEGRDKSGRGSGPKELVTGGFSGLYSRLKQSVGAGTGGPPAGAGGSPTSDPARPGSRSSYGYAETASLKSTSSTAVRSAVAEERGRTLSSATGSPVPHAKSTNHISRNSLNLLNDAVSIASSKSPADSNAPVDLKDADLAPLSLVRTKDGAHSRPGSRDLSKITITKPQDATAEASPKGERRDASARASLVGPFHGESPPLSDDDEPVKTSDAARSAQALQKPLDPNRLSQSFEATDKTSHRRSQNSLHAEQSLGVRLEPASPSLKPSSNTAAPKDDAQRPKLRVSPSHLPNLRISQPSSTDGETLSMRSGANTPALEPSPNINVGFQPRRLPTRQQGQNQPPSAKTQAVIPAHLKRRVVSKEFWMKDENARDCFYCGDAFSTFRRKHHCRTCGQIFDAKCTTLVAGRPFGQPGTLRLCKPCESIIYGSDDDSTIFSDDEPESQRSPEVRFQHQEPPSQFNREEAAIATPSIGIPVSRRNREAKRRSAVIEFDAQPVLARPSSSRSLKSMSGRPRSSSHKRHHSKHQPVRSLKHTPEERGPFYQDATDMERRLPLPAFHNDNIIDPDLAPFLSDDGSDMDDQPSIFAALNGDMTGTSPADGEKAGLASFLASAVKKGRSRRGDRSVGGQSLGNRADMDGLLLPARHNTKLNRKRNPSISSLAHARPSPRRSRSTNLLRALDFGGDAYVSPLIFESLPPPDGPNAAQFTCSSAMHGLNAPAIELNSASLDHVHRLLSQLLKDAKIAQRKRWEKALMPILLRCTDDVDPDVQNGDDMDVRNYIKLKKVPGGKPGDTAYVSGVVFSKNIALKGMRRSFVQPRIVIVTFAIEYARHNQHFMSLEPVIAQEREYLRNLVGRIAALRPHVLLVQRNVSGLALQMLQDSGITVVYNIKESVLAAVGRVTQTVLIKSVDKLSIDPSHLGHCANFDVKTYVHRGRKRTFVWMSGCQVDLGCTIVLRGAEMETLRQIKRITEFMCYVVYNLRLETCLMRDEFALIPSVVRSKASPASEVKSQGEHESEAISTSNPEVPRSTDLALDDKDIPGTENHVTVQERNLDHLDHAANHEQCDPATVTSEDEIFSSEYRELVDTARTRLISSSPFVKFPEPYLLVKVQDQERKVEQTKRLRDRYGSLDCDSSDKNDGENENIKIHQEFEMISPEMIDEVVPQEQSQPVRKFLHAVHDAQYQMALHEYEIKKRQWESFYLSSNQDPFNPLTHQNIFVLHSLVSSVTSVPCAGPEVLGLNFYAGYGNSDLGLEEDCTLGQFIEDVCAGATTTCKVCSRKMLDHHRQYVHGTGQLSVSVKRYPSKFQNLHNTIFMWSSCKVCQQETTWIPMSDNSWKYSLGKYLELSFWSTPLKPRAGVCPHDIHKDFVRCFAFQGLVVRVQYDKVELYNVLVPTSTINWEVNAGLELKNQLYSQFESRLSAFITSIKARLHSINLSTVAPEKAANATALVEKLMQRAESDHQDLLQKLRDKYMDSKFYEIIPLNRAVRMMDEKAIAWDEAFVDFERNYFPSENDIRRLATLQLKKLFLDRNEAQEAAVQDVNDNGEGMEMQERTPPSGMRLTDEELQSEKAQNMLTSVVEEHNHSGALAKPMAPITKALADEEGKDEASDATLLARQLSPIEMEQAVDREDVKHLDLAIPASLSPEKEPGSGTTSPTPEQAGDVQGNGDDSKSPDIVVLEPKPLTSTILERIEQMRSASSGADPLPESRIPRLTNLKRGPASPSLVRTQSQPSHPPRRSIDLTGEMPSIEAVASGEHSGNVTPTQNHNANRDLARSIEQRLADRLGTGRKAQASLIPRSVPSKPIDVTTRVSALAKHFEQLSREFERERLRERRQRAARSRQVRANPLASSRPVVEVYRDAREAVGERADDLKISHETLSRQPSRTHTEEGVQTTDHQPLQESAHDEEADTTDHYTTDTEMGGSTLGHDVSDTEAEGEVADELTLPAADMHTRLTDSITGISSSALLSPSSPHEIDQHLELSIPKHEKSSLMKMLTSFWSERSASGWSPLEYPILSTEHVFDDSDIIVREDEPASVIALALSSADYLSKLREFRGNPHRGAQRAGGHSHTESSSSFNFAAHFPSSEAGMQSSIEASLISETGTHMKYSFAHGPVKATCKIFYAESFDALRRKCGVSERFVESLSRCAKWDSKGGKTKSLFLKTLDDRFVIKSLQEVELKAFTKFAPDYFAFMSHTLFHGVPSVIAKMFGLFQVIIKNPNTNIEFSSYLLVMENLFYSRRPTRRFDLKGSMRNRKVERTGAEDEVLLDENLVETIFETPLFVREHARKLLKASVWNDTMWLCKQNVMDYSLMAGFDDERKELVVGIIDCIRTYTWDKKLESWIKDRGKNKPTITSPKDYRNRFRVSMMQYVLQAPNVWHGFLTLSNVTNANNQSNFPGAYGEAGFVAALGGSLKGGLMDREKERERNGMGGERESNNERDESVAEAHLMNDATIREMSTMAFA
ncbi:hypothetical protein MBLNU459_g6469t1 [Dothideomycetes sp. NU459]